MTPSRGLRRIFSAALAAAMIFSWTAQAVSQAAEVEVEATRAVAYSKQLERSLMAIEDGRRELPRDRWDPQYVVDTVGIDPSALYAYVRDEIGWIPYRGTLRGPVGALMDRQANALDSSLLLADLMTRAGYRTRLAHAQLQPEAVDAIWTYFAENAATPPEPVETGARAPETGVSEYVAQPAAGIVPAEGAVVEAAPTDPPAGDSSGSLFGDPGGTSGSLFGATPSAEPAAATPDEVAELYELDKDAAARKLTETSAARESVTEELDRRTISQGARLLRMFASSEDGAQQAYEQARARDALADHWWVQAEVNGAWTDFDTLGPDGEPGATWTGAEETIARDQLPAELRHRVALRVVAEQLLNGRLVEHTVLEHEVLASEVIGKPISLRHLPLLWPSEWAAVTPDDVQEKLFAALVTQNEWMPALTVGQEAFQQSSILDTGAVNPDPQPKSNPFLQVSFPAAGKVGRVADLFDQLLEESAALGGDAATQPSAGDKPRADGELTAEWLEYTLLVPGEEPKVTRRDVFDIVGPAVRMSGDLSGFRLDEDKRLARAGGQMTETEIIILPAWPAAEYLADMTAQVALANRPLLSEFTRDPFGKSPPNSIELFSKMTSLPAAAYLYSKLRSEVSVTQGVVFIDRPQIVAQHGVLTRVGPGEMTAKAALDVIENGVGVDPFVVDPFVIRLLQGVADTNAEALALGDAGENVGEAFEKALDEPEWTVFFPDDADLIGTLGLPPDTQARLVADLDAGQVIVSPAGNAQPFELAGWWRVDPLTGTTLGMGNNGWGSVLVEYAFVLVVKVMLAQIACMAYTAAAEEKIRGLTAEQGREKVKTWAKNCVSQALLETVAGLSIGWIQSRFIEGAKVPTWNKNANPKSNGPKGKPTGGSPTGGSPTGGSPTGGSPTGGKPTGGSPTGGSPTGGSPTGGSPTGGSPTGGSPTGGSPTGGSPTGGSPTAGSPPGGSPTGGKPIPPVTNDRRGYNPCRADAGFVKFAALSGSREIRRDFAMPGDVLLAGGAGCGPGSSPPSSGSADTKRQPPQQQPAKPNFDDDKLPPNRKPAPDTVRDPSRPPPSSGSADTRQGPKPNFEDDKLPSRYPNQQRGGPDTVADHGGDTVREPVPPTQRAADPLAPTERAPARGEPIPPTQPSPGNSRGPETVADRGGDTVHDPVPPTQRSPGTDGPAAPATKPGIGPNQDAFVPTERAPGQSGPATKPGVGPNQDAFVPTERQPGGPIPPTQRSASTGEPIPPTQRSPELAGPDTVRDPVPATQRAADPLAPTERAPGQKPEGRFANDAERMEAIKPFADETAAAGKRVAEARAGFEANRSAENLSRLDQANRDYARAYDRELDAYDKAGGTALFPPGEPAPPTQRSPQGGSGPLTQQSPQALAPSSPNNTLALGLGSLVGTVEKGP